MTKILTIIWKNLKLLLRSRISALIILLGPLVIILLVSLAFNSSEDAKVNVGYYSPQYNDLTLSFVEVLNNSKYSLHQYDSIEECKTSLGTGKAHLCISFPSDFRIENNRANQIDFFVDNSKINFFQSVVDSIEFDFNKHALSLTTGMTKELLSKLNQTSGELYDKASIITELKAENADIKKDIEDVEANIKAMNLGFQYDAFGVADFQKSSTGLSGQYDQMRAIAQNAIKEARSVVSDVHNFADDVNLTDDEQDELDSILNSTKTEITSIENSLNTASNASKAPKKELTDQISKLSSNLKLLGTRLENASKSKEGASLKVIELKKEINQSRDKILAVEATFNAITSNIMNTEITNVDTIVNPITKNIRPVITEESQLNFYFPYLIILIIMFIGILLSSIVVIMEKTSRAYFRNFVTPTSDSAFMAGTYFTTMLILLIQILILMSIFAVFSDNNYVSNLPTIALILFLATTLFTFIGMIIGNMLNSEETGMLTSISLGSLMLFISELIFPLERMPAKIAVYVAYNPFVICSEALRKAIVHNVPIQQMQEQLILLIIFVVVSLLLVILSYKYVKRHFLLAFAGYLARKDLRRRIKMQNSKKLFDIMNALHADLYFVTKDNKKISNIKELYEYIEKLNKEDFTYYSDNKKNVFADWISNNLKNEALAVELYKAKTKKQMLKELERTIDEFEKFEKEAKKVALEKTKEKAEEKEDKNEKKAKKKKE
jgi:ABC-type multidrug transport system permease subunit